MRKSKFSPQLIARILKEFDNGKTAAEISREYGVSKAAFYKWRERYSGMNGKELNKLVFKGGLRYYLMNMNCRLQYPVLSPRADGNFTQSIPVQGGESWPSKIFLPPW